MMSLTLLSGLQPGRHGLPDLGGRLLISRPGHSSGGSKLKALPYFKWYPADAECDQNFRAMDDADIGFYIRCLNHAWINGSIPADPKERARVLRTRLDTANKRWVRVGKCFVNSTLYPEQLINLRQETERSLASLKSLKAAESVNHRYERNTNEALRALATESETESETDKYKEPPKPPAPNGACSDVPVVREVIKALRSKRKDKRTTEQVRAALGPERLVWWENFWEVFPCHDGMNEGINAFEIRVKDHDLAVQVWKGAKSYRAKCDADPTIKVKFAQGWINSERWLDENNLPAIVPKPQQKSFLADIEQVMQRNVKEKGSPW
jgi:hypothetical protein